MNCDRCGKVSADQFCRPCEDSLVADGPHLANHCVDLRRQRDDLAQTVRDLEKALNDCAAEVARLKASIP